MDLRVRDFAGVCAQALQYRGDVAFEEAFDLLGRPAHEPGDDAEENCYTRAARFLRQWLREGVLFREPDPAVYVYHQVFRHAGSEFTRRGFMARCGLQRFGEGNIFPHEETMSGPKEDRLKLTRACKANLSQIFGIYPDAENEAQNILEAAVAGGRVMGLNMLSEFVDEAETHLPKGDLHGPIDVLLADTAGRLQIERASGNREDGATVPEGAGADRRRGHAERTQRTDEVVAQLDRSIAAGHLGRGSRQGGAKGDGQDHHGGLGPQPELLDRGRPEVRHLRG